MKILLIGAKNVNNEPIFTYMAEKEMDFNCTREVVTLRDIEGMIDLSDKYDCVILDIFAYPLDSLDFKKAMEHLQECFNGKVIVFAPSASYTDEKIAICEQLEYTTIIRDFLGARVKAKLAQLFPATGNNQPTTTKKPPQTVKQGQVSLSAGKPVMPNKTATTGKTPSNGKPPIILPQGRQKPNISRNTQPIKAQPPLPKQQTPNPQRAQATGKGGQTNTAFMQGKPPQSNNQQPAPKQSQNKTNNTSAAPQTTQNLEKDKPQQTARTISGQTKGQFSVQSAQEQPSAQAYNMSQNAVLQQKSGDIPANQPSRIPTGEAQNGYPTPPAQSPNIIAQAPLEGDRENPPQPPMSPQIDPSFNPQKTTFQVQNESMTQQGQAQQPQHPQNAPVSGATTEEGKVIGNQQSVAPEALRGQEMPLDAEVDTEDVALDTDATYGDFAEGYRQPNQNQGSLQGYANPYQTYQNYPNGTYGNNPYAQGQGFPHAAQPNASPGYIQGQQLGQQQYGYNAPQQPGQQPYFQNTPPYNYQGVPRQNEQPPQAGGNLNFTQPTGAPANNVTGKKQKKRKRFGRKGKQANAAPEIQRQTNTNHIEPPKFIVTKKVGIIGLVPRMGTTTQALAVLQVLNEHGQPNCYIQNFKSTFLSNMANYLSDAQMNPIKNCLEYNGMDFYKNQSATQSQDYFYRILDYGYIQNRQIPTDFFANDVRILVCGSSLDEVDELTSLRDKLNIDKELIFVFNFVSDHEKEDIYDIMGDKTMQTFFAPYNPDCFNATQEAKNLYAGIFGIQVEPEPQKGLFKRKRKR